MPHGQCWIQTWLMASWRLSKAWKGTSPDGDRACTVIAWDKKKGPWGRGEWPCRRWRGRRAWRSRRGCSRSTARARWPATRRRRRPPVSSAAHRRTHMLTWHAETLNTANSSLSSLYSVKAHDSYHPRHPCHRFPIWIVDCQLETTTRGKRIEHLGTTAQFVTCNRQYVQKPSYY